MRHLVPTIASRPVSPTFFWGPGLWSCSSKGEAFKNSHARIIICYLEMAANLPACLRLWIRFELRTSLHKGLPLAITCGRWATTRHEFIIRPHKKATYTPLGSRLHMRLVAGSLPLRTGTNIIIVLSHSSLAKLNSLLRENKIQPYWYREFS